MISSLCVDDSLTRVLLTHKYIPEGERMQKPSKTKRSQSFKLDVSLFWISQYGNNNKLALPHRFLFSMNLKFVVKGLLIPIWVIYIR